MFGSKDSIDAKPCKGLGSKDSIDAKPCKGLGNKDTLDKGIQESINDKTWEILTNG